jgi:hypothetical protein
MRKALIVSYHFPPDIAVGGLRSSRLMRSLPDFAWDPMVLTVKADMRGQTLDPERLEGLNTDSIFRTRDLPNLSGWYRAAKSLLAKHPVRQESSVQEASDSSSETLPMTLKRYIVSLFIFLPDAQKTWALLSAWTAVRLIRREKVDCIITSAPPASVHFVGLIAKAFTNVKWIADFRDPWLESLDARPPSTRSRASDAIERRMEAAVVKHADRVLTTTPRMAEAMRLRYSQFPQKTPVCVTNSFDNSKFQTTGAVEKYATFTITYAGTLYEGRTPEPLFAAIGGLIREGHIKESDVRIKLVGDCGFIDGIPTMSVAKRHGVEGVVEILDAVPHAEAVRIMQKSHLLLVISPELHRLIVPAKLYDYLGAGSRVVALAEPGATTDLIQETGSGECFSLSDVAGLRSHVHRLITTASVAWTPNAASLQRFSSREMTARFARELTAVCAQ